MAEEDIHKVVPVTQIDRNAAADIQGELGGEAYRDGRYDTGIWVQAFARHRILAERLAG